MKLKIAYISTSSEIFLFSSQKNNFHFQIFQVSRTNKNQDYDHEFVTNSSQGEPERVSKKTWKDISGNRAINHGLSDLPIKKHISGNRHTDKPR